MCGTIEEGYPEFVRSNEFCDGCFEGNPVVVFLWIGFGFFVLFLLVKGDPKQTAITGHISMIILYFYSVE